MSYDSSMRLVWHPIAMPPRHQYSPMVWSDDLNGLVLHGGELQHGGPQFGTTWLLKGVSQ